MMDPAWLQLTSGQVINGRFQTLLTNGDMVWFTEEHDEKERQWLVDVAQVGAIAEPWQDAVVPASVDDPLVRRAFLLTGRPGPDQAANLPLGWRPSANLQKVGRAAASSYEDDGRQNAGEPLIGF
jgi:hypothetical protein